jgi:hypothetical protein
MAQQTYSKFDAEERAKYWLQLIDHNETVMKPWFMACQVLEDQYNNAPASQREADIEDFGGNDDSHTLRVKAGLVFGWIDQSIANMLDSKPYIAAKATNVPGISQTEPVAKIQNHYYTASDQLRHDERVALDAFLMPYGAWKIGYSVDFDDRMQDIIQDEAVQEIDPENAEFENQFLVVGQATRVTEYHDHEVHIEEHTIALQDPMLGAEGQFTLKAHIALHKVFRDRAQPDANVTVKREAPFGLRWRPDHFLVDENAQDGLNDAGWIAFKSELPLMHVQSDPAYKNTQDIKATHRSDGETVDHNTQSPFDMVWIYEIWARNFAISRGKFRNLLITVVEGHDRPIREEDEWPYHYLEDYPAEVLHYQSGIRTWFNKPPLLMAGAESLQSLVNEILDGFLYTVRKQKNIWLYDPAYVDEETLSQILDGPDGTMIPIKMLADENNARNIVVPLPFHSVPGERSQLMQIAQQMLDRTAGTPQPITLPGTESATESSILDRKNTARENRRATLLSRAQVRKARKFWQLIVQFQPPDIGLIDEMAGQAITMTEAMVMGRYDFSLEISSQSANIAVERAQWLELLNLLSGMTPLLQQSFGMEVDVPELVRRLLVRGYREPDARSLVRPANPQALPPDAGPVNPQAEASAGALDQGRAVQSGQNVLHRDTSRGEGDMPNEGKQLGAAQ